MMVSFILMKDILDSSRIGSIRRPEGFINFSFSAKYYFYLGLKIQS